MALKKVSLLANLLHKRFCRSVRTHGVKELVDKWHLQNTFLHDIHSLNEWNDYKLSACLCFTKIMKMGLVNFE
jgi:hypothetical protein